ncbi:hypothetical protein JCM11251_004356 [Rhodosporidiobolus azoricus]
MATELLPDFEAGVEYWANTEASVNGVLGGYGEGTPVPRLDATASRLLILSLLPQLSTITPPHLTQPSSASSASPRPSRPFRALDCGAGIGRVTSTVLLALFDTVDLVEPVPSFVERAKNNALEGKEGWAHLHPSKTGAPPKKGVRIWKAGLQHFDPICPTRPVGGGKVELFATVGGDAAAWVDPGRELDVKGGEGYDIVMIQWCIGHLSDDELVTFLLRSRAALRQSAEGKCEGFIVLKENVCKDSDGINGNGRLFDDDDSSITRSDKAFREVFARAGLTLLRREVQQGFPEELFPVVAYALQ